MQISLEVHNTRKQAILDTVEKIGIELITDLDTIDRIKTNTKLILKCKHFNTPPYRTTQVSAFLGTVNCCIKGVKSKGQKWAKTIAKKQEFIDSVTKQSEKLNVNVLTDLAKIGHITNDTKIKIQCSHKIQEQHIWNFIGKETCCKYGQNEKRITEGTHNGWASHRRLFLIENPNESKSKCRVGILKIQLPGMTNPVAKIGFTTKSTFNERYCSDLISVEAEFEFDELSCLSIEYELLQETIEMADWTIYNNYDWAGSTECRKIEYLDQYLTKFNKKVQLDEISKKR